MKLSCLATALSLSGLAVLSFSPGALAQIAITPIIDSIGGGAAAGGGAQTDGSIFALSGSLTIRGLGVFNSNTGNLHESHNTGLFNSSGTLLASTVIDNSATHVTSTNSHGFWLEKDITAITIGSGTYYLGSLYTNTSPDNLLLSTTATGISGVTPGSGTEIGGSTLAAPTNVLTSSGSYYSAMAFITPAATPEPGSLALLVGLGVTGAGFLVRRRKQAGKTA